MREMLPVIVPSLLMLIFMGLFVQQSALLRKSLARERKFIEAQRELGDDHAEVIRLHAEIVGHMQRNIDAKQGLIDFQEKTIAALSESIDLMKASYR